MSHPETVICRYVVRPGKGPEMERLLARHWPALHAAGLVTDEPSRIWRGRPSSKGEGGEDASNVYVEIFTWRSAEHVEATQEGC